MTAKLERIGDVIWELGRGFRTDMNVPVRILADDELIAKIRTDHSIEQLVNVTTLPGITRFALGMPDITRTSIASWTSSRALASHAKWRGSSRSAS